ncbi:hypothetical protein D9613_012159 [Agrocybe pediades]|uniref:Uncharacterized protein n=1 Tax=Agrocybe pediades TaxID=84607 RepID=A0A8H4R1N6_9AGAR|nr:hypothetical protein D9613_012159 [Agrocybe pediades]
MLPEDSSAQRKKQEEDAKKNLIQTPSPIPQSRYARGGSRASAALQLSLNCNQVVHFIVVEIHDLHANRWSIQPNQPIACAEHLAFKKMIEVAARATKGVKIPGRKKTKDAIMEEFGSADDGFIRAAQQ